MPCPSSPEPDAYHRFKLQPSGPTFTATCVYCGQARAQSAKAGQWGLARAVAQRRRGMLGNAAQRAKREEQG